MAPLSILRLVTRGAQFDPSITTDEFREQWTTPSDVFSVLLLLGGDVVARAIAQLAGSGPTPVAFSFGWVAYSVTALVSAVGENKLMPLDPDCRCKVIHGKSGYSRDNSSWILGRIVRDFDYWSDTKAKEKLDEVLKARSGGKHFRAGLIVSVYEPSRTSKAGVVKHDAVFWIGLPVMLFQLGIASIALGVHGEWGTLLITTVGIALSLTTGLLPQWKKEKWACRDKAKHDFILTRGNGSQHVIVVRGNGYGLNLEDLASGQSNIPSTSISTRIALLGLAILWILLLITAAGLKQNTWFLLAIGSVGMLQNIYVAGAPRRPENFGIPLDFVEVFGHQKAMRTLLEVERSYKNVGHALLQEFFPGKLSEEEKLEWAELQRYHESEAAQTKVSDPEDSESPG
ncbi:hypothetical protein B0T19DRAFT_435232 [Cercophora scortea]|uniref:Uncharacterized protein n=1 Tax=Cercophora scortea TaxID=314031 RepID=A0AAE0M3D3_9PEZI|nr:hypothetical protein B0T19DRAFT_435232 [Cercophora scortea]